MGFMDKAKKMAEQAQTKLDEAQKQFNEKPGLAGLVAGPGRVGHKSSTTSTAARCRPRTPRRRRPRLRPPRRCSRTATRWPRARLRRPARSRERRAARAARARRRGAARSAGARG